MSLEKFADMYRNAGFEVEIDSLQLNFALEDEKFFVVVDEEWKKILTAFFKAKQFEYDSDGRVLSSYRCVEFQAVRLDSSFLPRPEHIFTDEKRNKVTLGDASNDFTLSLLSGPDNSSIMDLIKRRAKRRIEIRRKHSEGPVKFRLDDILIKITTVRYEIPRKIKRETLVERGRSRAKACLFKLSFSHNENWELRESMKSRKRTYIPSNEDVDDSIPRATYIDDLVSFYKVAKSSQFLNQAFLSYYHILEYFFLRVSDEKLHESVKSHVNSLTFSSDYENINRLLSIVQKHDNSADETEMLKSVLTKHISEKDLIEFLISLEKENGEKTYSDPKKKIFGERATIRLEEGHALSNTSKVIKHVRNSLVHSSDKYAREDTYLPFSKSEDIVNQYVPVVKYLAERVIYATAS